MADVLVEQRIRLAALGLRRVLKRSNTRISSSIMSSDRQCRAKTPVTLSN
jgi:hypothetical protein